MTEWGEILKHASLWGPGLIILAGIYGLVRRPPRFVGEFIDSQKSQAAAMTKMADAVDRSTQRESLRLEQLQIGVQMILDRIDRMECSAGPIGNGPHSNRAEVGDGKS